MGTFKDATKSHPCPICGKTDWCSHFIPDNPAYSGQELPVCRRIHVQEIQSPIDGHPYYFVKEFPDASVLYTDTPKSSTGSRKQKGYAFKPSDKVISAPKKPEIPVRSNKELNLIYRDLLSMLQLSKRHNSMLRKDGWSAELIKKSRISSLHLKKSFDESKKMYSDQHERKRIAKLLLEKHSSLIGVPGFYQDEDGQWTFVGKQGILIPIYDRNHNIYRLRLRLDRPDLDEKGKEKNKYKNFSSYAEEKNEGGELRNIYMNGCRAGSQVGIYYDPACDSSAICYITEGEKKAIVANHVLKCIVISLPGVNTFSKLKEKDTSGISTVDFLRSIGCKKTIVAYDADKSTNNVVQRCEEKLITLLKESSFETYTTSWNPGFGKGLDDILLLGVYPTIHLI